MGELFSTLRSKGADRAVAAALQCDQTAFLARLSSASTRDDLVASVCSALRGTWLVTFINYDLGYIDLEQRNLQPIDNPFGPRL